MRHFLLLICSVLIATTAFAQDGDGVDTKLPLGNGQWLSSWSSNHQTNNRLLRSDTSDNTYVNAPSGSTVKMSVAKTPYASVGTGGLTFVGAGVQPIFPSASVLTPAVTYGAGLGAITARYSTVATAGPTSMFLELPAPTANVGKAFNVTNYAANAAQLVPPSGVVNVSGALTPFSCASQKECTCTALTSSGYWCVAK